MTVTVTMKGGTGKSGVLLTASDVAAWREERDQLEADIKERQERLAIIKRKLDAADMFLMEVQDDPRSVLADPASFFETEEEEGSDSVSDALVVNLRTTKDSLKVGQIRDRLAQIGFADKVKARPNYVYGLVYRLTKKGRLIKRGARYRAAPISSPQGETGAVAAPAPSPTH
jgi:hypothetical protein